MAERKQLERLFDKEDIHDLLKRSRHVWSRFNLVEAFKARVQRDDGACFNAFLAENAVPESTVYAAAGERQLILWHATRRRHTENILEHGIFHHGGVFFAPPSYGLPFRLANGIPTRERGDPEALVVLACVFDTREYREGRDFIPGSSEYRFTSRVSADAVFAVITHEAVECVGAAAPSGDRLSPVRFVRRGKNWAISTQNPQRFPGGRRFRTPDEWLDHYLDFVFERNEALTLFEIVNGVYMNVEPIEAIGESAIIEQLSRRCDLSKKVRGNALLAKAAR